MFRKVIAYTDYNGVERKEEFSFNFTKAEIWDLNLRTPGGLKSFYERIIATEDGQELADQFKMLIQKSYGIKSDDGRRFMKSDEILRNFTETEAYSNFYIELATNSDSAAAFVNGIMPKDLVEKAIAEGEAQAANGSIVQMPNFQQAQQPQQIEPTPVPQPVYSSDMPAMPMNPTPIQPQV